MPLLANPWKLIRHEDPRETPDGSILEIHPPDPSATVDRLLVLRPTEGGLAFRMYGFPDMQSANEYVQTHLWLEAQTGVSAFWALQVPPTDPGDPPDAVVIVRDPYHPGIVQLYSFVNMDAAQDFVRQEFRNGIDLNLVLVYWAEYVEIDRPPELTSGMAPERAYFARPTIDRHADEFPRELTRVRMIDSGEKTMAMKQTSAQIEEDADSASAKEQRVPSRLSLIAQDIVAWPGWDGLVPRMVEALKLNEDIFAETERDRHATGRARLIFSIAVLAAGFGALGTGIGAAMWQIAFSATAWLAFVAIIFWFGTTVAGGRRTNQTFTYLVRSLGLAAAPGIFLSLGFVPIYGAIPVLGVYVWIFLTSVHAVTPTLELDSQSSVVTAAVGILTLFAIAQVLPVLLA